jgi:photosystem II stability/assembly factor-like uncharacterized protein
MWLTRSFLAFVFLGVVAQIGYASEAPEAIDPEYFAGMKARSIGPAGMSGRIGDIQVVPADPRVIYVGAATGGVWKSVNGGVTWTPIFDDQNASSIGAIAISPDNPETVWVGTGEANTRNSAGVGRGVFKTLNGGESWEFLGLEKTEKVSRVLLHPHNPEVAYVAALGTTWGENPDRGVFKTVDGGETWEKILFVDEKTGAADLVMDPANPNRLLAAMWEHRRWPWFFRSGGPGSGLYLTTDGGKNWKKLTDEDGLPEGELGRIGLAFARSRPNVVYALVEAEKSALCRSEDSGKTWKIVNSEPGVNPRPFYYADIRVHPTNENTVYRLGGRLDVSIDGGKSFEQLMPFLAVHGDFQTLWIHPEETDLMFAGGDGGIGISYDAGKQWKFVQNLPLAQYYHINVDMERPYNIYGGMQDNGSWRGPSRVPTRGGIFNFYWDMVGFGDGFATLPSPRDSRIGYAMSQGGYLMRFDLRTREIKDIRPPAPQGVKLRFNWNAAIAIDPHDPETMYYGSQFVHRTKDEGQNWEIISSDLTTNDPEKQKQADSGGLTHDVTNAENHCSIITIAPSPVSEGVVWVGTDDGNVQLTRDGGQTWTLVSKALTEGRSVPSGTWVPHVEPSHSDAGTAYVVFDDHRRSNWTPYLFITENYGQTWRSLVSRDIDGFIHVIEEDPVDKNLLFVGTEFGLYVSFNRGGSWMKWTAGLPTAPVRALVVHPLEHDLVIGTHGRAAYILDDIRPLRALSAELTAKELHLFPVADAYQYRTSFFGGKGYLTPGNMEFQGQNRLAGALITYSLHNAPSSEEKEKEEEEEEDSLEIEILDAGGEVIRTVKGPLKDGMQRASWDLRRKAFEAPPDPDRWPGEEVGPHVLPGAYTVRIQLGETTAEQNVRVHPDPRSTIDVAEREQKYTALMETGKLLEAVTAAYKKIDGSLQAIDDVSKRSDELEDAQKESIQSKGKALQEKLKSFSRQLTQSPEQQGIWERTQLAVRLEELSGRMQSSFDAPTAGQRSELEELKAKVQETLGAINQLFAGEFQEFKREVEASGLTLFPKDEPIPTT